MRFLILSDIHANWEALEAVLNAAAGAYDKIVCCGDLVGYGADPNRVVDWARANVSVVVRGNHDRACVGLDDLQWFNPVARAAALWTLRELTPENRTYIRGLPKGPLRVSDFQLMHGSPLDEDEYVADAGEAAPVFSYLEAPVAFFGHTHLQGGFQWVRRQVRVIGPVTGEPVTLELEPESAYFLNPGSVGQPRDGNPRTGYILYAPESRFLRFHRPSYDIEAAQDKIQRAGLPRVLADRLTLGK